MIAGTGLAACALFGGSFGSGSWIPNDRLRRRSIVAMALVGPAPHVALGIFGFSGSTGL